MVIPSRLALALGAFVAMAVPAWGQSTEEPFGFAVAGVGDVNGDGVPDVVVGAPGARPGGHAGAGRAVVFSGKDGSVLFTFPGSGRNEGVGSAVAGPGDVNGDGKPDVAVGAPGFQIAGMGWAGAVRMFSGTDGKLLWEVHGEWKFGKFGKSLAIVGDLDGDGVSDLIVGAPGAKAGDIESAGAVRVLSGKDGKPILTVYGKAAYEELGTVVVGAGDANGDGTPDFAAANPLADGRVRKRAGFVRVFSGKDGAVLQDLRGDLMGGGLGASLAVIGDLDGDGRPDLAVAAPLSMYSKTMAAGLVEVHSGASGTALAHWVGSGKVVWDGFGLGIAAPGDMNGDKVPDLWVAAMGGETVAEESGKEKRAAERIDLVSGRDGAVLRTIHSTQFGEMLGTALAVVGDVNGDRVPDLLAGAPGAPASEGRTEAGVARIYSGKDGAILLTLLPPDAK